MKQRANRTKRGAKKILEFTPLEFETMRQYNAILQPQTALEFTPLEFETNIVKRQHPKVLYIRIYSVGV